MKTQKINISELLEIHVANRSETSDLISQTRDTLDDGLDQIINICKRIKDTSSKQMESSMESANELSRIYRFMPILNTMEILGKNLELKGLIQVNQGSSYIDATFDYLLSKVDRNIINECRVKFDRNGVLLKNGDHINISSRGFLYEAVFDNSIPLLARPFKTEDAEFSLWFDNLDWEQCELITEHVSSINEDSPTATTEI